MLDPHWIDIIFDIEEKPDKEGIKLIVFENVMVDPLKINVQVVINMLEVWGTKSHTILIGRLFSISLWKVTVNIE